MLGHSAATILITIGLTAFVQGQTERNSASVHGTSAKALAFFEQIEDRSFDDYLKRVRLPKVSEVFKAEVLARIAKGKEVKVFDGLKSNLAALEPILRYHERDSVIEIRVIGVKYLFVGLQGRAVLLISEPALYQLPLEELQAAVAHELGHEYFWAEFMEARQQKKHEVMREIELRCDGIAVIALRRLRLDPAKLVSALSRMRMLNARIVNTDPFYHPEPDERSRFIRAMSELAQTREMTERIITRN